MNDNVDYAVPAELFPPASGRGKVAYRRFDSLAEPCNSPSRAWPPAQLTGSFIEAEEVRFGAVEIRALYDAESYPLVRQKRATTTPVHSV